MQQLIEQKKVWFSTIEQCNLWHHNIIYAEVREKVGKTPLHFACENGHLEVIQYLVENLQIDISKLRQLKICAKKCNTTVLL